MTNKLALALVIGGAVSSTVGSAFSTVSNGIRKLEQQGNRAKVLKSTIGETIKLRDEWKRAHDSGAAGADKLRHKLENNLSSLRKQGIEVGRLGREYQRLAREAKAADLQIKGRTQLGEGAKGLKSTAGQAMAFSASLAIPTKVSGDYQAKIRQMALWAHIAGQGEEQELADKIAKVAADVGMGQQALATAVSGLIEKGIDWQESVDYAPLIADLIDGQGMEAETIATLFSAFKEAGVKKEDMGAMLGQVAAAGDIGAFGPKDMARYMPSLLGTIKTLGMEGPEAVRFLGASLQSQYKQTQNSAAAATNMNNLLNAVISTTSQQRFAKQGIDLAGSIARAVKTGKADNPVEAFIKLSDVLLKQQDPSKFKEVQALKKRIQESANGSAEEAQAMASLLESAGLATIVSDQSAQAGLLAQIKYGGAIKEDMATIKETDGKAKIGGDAEKARETSNAKWDTVKASSEAAMTRIGDAIRPMTDSFADGLAKITYAVADMVEKAPNVVTAIAGIGAAFLGAKTLFSGFKIGKGLFNLARGKLLGAGKDDVQKVFVTNQGDGDGDGGEGEGDGSPRSKVLGLLHAGLKAFKKGDSSEGAADDESAAGGESDKEEGGFNLVDAGLTVLDVMRNAAGEDGDGDGADAGPQKVFVVNVADFRGIGSTMNDQGRRRRRGGAGGNGRGRGRGRGRGGNGSSDRDRSPRPRPPRPPAPPAPPPAPPRVGRIGSAMNAVGKVAAVGKRLPGAALLNAGMSVIDTTMKAETTEEKAEGYGSAAGGLAGTLAGAAAGAAIGSVVPVIGTAIGGAIGAALGGMGGESLGSWLGKRLFGDDSPEADDKEKAKPAPDEPLPVTDESAAPSKPATVAASAPPGPAVPALGDLMRAPAGSERAAAGPLVVNPIALPAPVVVVRGERTPVVVPAPVPLPPSGLGSALRDTAQSASSANSPAVIDRGERAPAAAALAVPPSALGDAVRDLAQAKPNAAPPVQDGSATPAPLTLPAAPDNRDRLRVVVPVPEQPSPMGQAMRDLASVKPAGPAPLILRPNVTLTAPAPAPRAPVVVTSPAGQDKPSPAKAERQPVVPAPAGKTGTANMGDVVRNMAKAAPPVPKLPDVAKPARTAPAAKAAKVDQAFTFSPTVAVTVHGDVKDPDQLAREMEPQLRRLYESFKRDADARMASIQLFDSPHL